VFFPFLCLRKCSDGSHKFPVATARFSCHHCDLNSSQLKWPPNYLPKLCDSPLIHKIRIPRPLAQATASNHPNVFTPPHCLFQKDERGEAWEPFSRTMLFLSSTLQCEGSVTSPVTSDFKEFKRCLGLTVQTVHTHNMNPQVPYLEHSGRSVRLTAHHQVPKHEA
jgi:hypothetical protein